MKSKKTILILTLVLLTLLTLSTVSANDNTTDTLNVNDNNDNTISQSHEKQLKLDDDNDNSISSNNEKQTSKLDDNKNSASKDYDKSVYVKTDGSDSNAGTENSPYNSINKAISSVNASDNAVIYLGEGIFTGENNTDLSINLAHKENNGSLTFIGKGKEKTIIDANYEGQIFKTISADSIITFMNITFMRGKAGNYGSAIVSDGDLTIDNCLFEKNEANSYATVYQDEPNNFKVLNSEFKDNIAKSGNANIYYSTYQDSDCVVEIINNIFSNATTDYSWADSSCVYVQASHILVKGNTFINISGTGKGSALNVRADDCNVTDNVFKDCSYDGSNDGGILYIGDAYIKGNTFENWTSTKGAPIYALLNFNAYLAYDDKLVNETTFKLTCNVTDDMGNLVNTYGEVFFYLNNENLGRTKANNGVATLTVNKLMDNGVYDLTGTYGYVSFGESSNPFGCTVKNATITVDFDHNLMDVWVSADGNDTTGDGSEDNPFQTIKNAIDYAISKDSVDFTVHVKDGLYNISGDYGLSYSDVVKFSIIGENYGKAIISGNNAGVTFLTSNQYTDVSLKNLTFVNSTANRAFNVRYLTMDGCIVDNVGQLYAQSNPSRVVFRNVTWSNTRNLMIYNGEIYDSCFENITTDGTGVLWLATVSDDDMIVIMNSKFINITNTGSNGAVAYVQGNFISINNTYISNKASQSDYGVLYVSADYAVSINDTFINNEAADDYGAAFFVGRNQDSFIGIKNAKFINNTAGGNGGALGTYGAVLVNCTFENNTARKDGGAIYTLTHASSYSYFDNLTLTDVTFKDNSADGNGQDIFITPPTSASYSSTNLADMTVSFNDLTTKHLEDAVIANVTHTSGAIIGGGKITFTLDDSYMGVADVINGVAKLDYLGFTTDGTYKLSGEYDLACEDTEYNNATVTVKLDPLLDSITAYVSNSTGNDATGDGSLEKPYKTIETALNNAYKQSKIITIRILEGTYSGALNTNLTIASTLDISLVGDGQNKTIIDGEDNSWFLNILAGNGIVKIANMTICNVTKNYVDSKLYNQHPAISIEKGAIVSIDNVGFIRCHGTEGGAIYSEGTLNINNAYFFNNGDSNYGAAIKNYGTVTIYNSEFIANHAKYYSTIYNDGNLYLYDSIIQDSMRVNGWTGNAMVMGGAGNITIVNSTISRSGKTSNELIGTGQTWANNPGFAISIGSTGNVKVIDSIIDGNNKAYSAQYITNVAFGGSGSIGVFVPYGLEVVNTKILNLKDIISGSKGTNYFNGCYIENVTYVSEGTSYDYNMTVVNSYFADGTTMVTKRATANVILNNNWWGNNSQPTYKVGSVDTHPDTWLILTLNTTTEGNAILAFKSFDGENITDFDGSVYPREFSIEAVNATLKVNNGTITNNVVIPLESSTSTGLYINASVDGQKVNLTRTFTELSASANPIHVGQNITVEVDHPNDLKNNVTVIIDGNEYFGKVNGSKTIIIIPDLDSGNYIASVHYMGDDVYLAKTIQIYVKVIAINIQSQDVEKYYKGSEKLNITVIDGEGAILANEKVTAIIEGKPYEAITNPNGKASFDLNMTPGNYVVEIVLNTTKVTSNVNIKSTVPEGIVNGTSAENGFEIKFVDSEGKPIANTLVTFEIDGEQVNKTTDSNGIANITKEDIGYEIGIHNITITNPLTKETVKSYVTVPKPLDTLLDITIPNENEVNKETPITIILKDENGKLIPNTQVIVSSISGNKTLDLINGVLVYQYTPKTIGNETLTFKYLGNYSLNNCTTIKTIVVTNKDAIIKDLKDLLNQTQNNLTEANAKNENLTKELATEKQAKENAEKALADKTTEATNLQAQVTKLTNDLKTASNNANAKIKKIKAAKKVKKSKNYKITVTLNKKVKGKYVFIAFNGKTYKAKTNAKGIAKITIKKSVLKKALGKAKSKKVKYQVISGNSLKNKSVKIKK